MLEGGSGPLSQGDLVSITKKYNDNNNNKFIGNTEGNNFKNKVL